VEDFEKILTEPDASLVEQYQALIKTEGLNVLFTDSAVHRIAEIAWEVNEQTENIGARRLYTVMERLLEKLSFDATDIAAKELEDITIDENYVNDHLQDLAKDSDLSRFIL
jgi:ATP-dependent HslUV protease ATP-binding subunit HslU